MLSKLLILAGLLCSFGMAQSKMYVLKTSLPTDTIDLNNVTAITFTTTNMTIGGVGKTIPLASISLMLFKDSPIVTPSEELTQGGASPLNFSEVGPNPFNPSTTVSFGLASKASVRVDVVNIKGAIIRTLTNSTLDHGFHRIVWDGKSTAGETVSSGTYIMRINVNGKSFDTKAVLVK